MSTGGVEGRGRLEALTGGVALALLAGATLLWVPFLADAWRFPKEAWVAVVGFALLALVSFQGRLPRLPAALLASLVVFAGAMLLAGARSPALYDGWHWGLVFCAWAGSVVALTAVLGQERAALRLERLVIFLAALQVLIGVCQLGVALVREGELSKLDFAGTLGNPDYVASFVAMGLLLALLGSGVPRGRWRSLLLVGLAGGVFLAASRGAFLALAMALALAYRGRLRGRQLAWVGGGAVLVLLGLAFLPGYVDLTSGHTLRGRFMLWTVALRQFAASGGLGIGLGAFRLRWLDGQGSLFAEGGWEGYFANASLVSRVHDEYLDFLVEAGVPGLLGFLGIAACALRAAWRSRHDVRSRAPAAVLVFALGHALVSFPFHVMPNLLLAGVAMARLFVLSAPGEPEPWRPARWAAAGAAVMVAFLLVHEGRGLVRDWHHGRALAAIGAGDDAGAREHLSRSLTAVPADYDVSLTSARLYYQRSELSAALTVLRDLEAQGRTIDAQKLQGRVLLEIGRPDQALPVLEALAAAYPRHVTPHYDLGRAHMALGQWEEAVRELEATLAAKPVSAKGRWEQKLAAEYLVRARSEAGQARSAR